MQHLYSLYQEMPGLLAGDSSSRPPKKRKRVALDLADEAIRQKLMAAYITVPMLGRALQGKRLDIWTTEVAAGKWSTAKSSAWSSFLASVRLRNSPGTRETPLPLEHSFVSAPRRCPAPRPGGRGCCTTCRRAAWGRFSAANCGDSCRAKRRWAPPFPPRNSPPASPAYHTSRPNVRRPAPRRGGAEGASSSPGSPRSTCPTFPRLSAPGRRRSAACPPSGSTAICGASSGWPCSP